MERIRELLDDAVAGIEPSIGDPVGAVVRRGRARRRRQVLATTLAVVLAGGGLVAAQRLVGHGTPAPTAEEQATEPPTPYVDGDVVVAGSMRIPIPAGWRVITPDSGKPCGPEARTIVIFKVDSNEPNCIGALEVHPTRNRNPSGYLVQFPSAATGGMDVLTTPVSFTLPGGEPAWLIEGLDSEGMQPLPTAPGRSFYETISVPWSMMTLVLREEGKVARQRLESIRTGPASGGALVLPRTAVVAEMTVQGATTAESRANFGFTKEPKKIGDALKLLRRQQRVVDDDAACANGAQRTVRLEFSPSAPPSIVVSSPPPKEELQEWRAKMEIEAGKRTTVVISLGGDCQEAVSSFGGRVRLSDGAVNDLKRLFGLSR
ncbi:hypothetical protein ACQPZX_21510 [Actinoplanes sp. CA-142083]|uniref:hypothetical protein n=1 Tax=Actinoplanes sp. CA-142083 TaxID=3239903 RepID=UPI003D8A0D6B